MFACYALIYYMYHSDLKTRLVNKLKLGLEI